MKNCRLIILSHYDFTDDKGIHLIGSKCKVASKNKSIDISFKGDSLHKLELLKEYKCDLYINEDLKIAITNVY